jgi:hypothetical protein
MTLRSGQSALSDVGCVAVTAGGAPKRRDHTALSGSSYTSFAFVPAPGPPGVQTACSASSDGYTRLWWLVATRVPWWWRRASRCRSTSSILSSLRASAAACRVGACVVCQWCRQLVARDARRQIVSFGRTTHHTALRTQHAPRTTQARKHAARSTHHASTQARSTQHAARKHAARKHAARSTQHPPRGPRSCSSRG